MPEEIRRTPKSWTHYLSDEDNPVTLQEYMAGCLSRILGAVIETAAATGHSEGILTAVDDMLARSNPGYAGDAASRLRLVGEAREQRRALEGGR